jgi:hypothetical protein
MILHVSKSQLQVLGQSIDAFLRRQGYVPIYDRRSGSSSYAKRLTRNHYPRFHGYVEEREDAWLLKLHLDQKQASYEGTSRHSGEYEGEAVAAEVRRLQSLLPLGDISFSPLKNKDISDIIPRRTLPDEAGRKPEKKGFFSRLFGK